MKRSDRFKKITDINLGFENIAGAALARARASYLKEEKQLEQLIIYRNEYQQKLKERLMNNISPNEILDYQYFFLSLDKAISQQVELLEKQSLLIEKNKQNWLMKKNEVAKFKCATTNLKNKELVFDKAIEQKEADERIQQNIHIHNSAKR